MHLNPLLKIIDEWTCPNTWMQHPSLPLFLNKGVINCLRRKRKHIHYLTTWNDVNKNIRIILFYFPGDPWWRLRNTYTSEASILLAMKRSNQLHYSMGEATTKYIIPPSPSSFIFCFYFLSDSVSLFFFLFSIWNFSSGMQLLQEQTRELGLKLWGN